MRFLSSFTAATTVINAITERKGVRTALVTTEGFRDVIAIGRGNRPDLYNLHSMTPKPFVPRHLRSKSLNVSTQRVRCERPFHALGRRGRECPSGCWR